MKTTFSRIFFSAMVILILALVLMGFSLRMLVKNYLTDNTVENLQNDAEVIANLAEIYRSGPSSGYIDFILNLNVASRVSGADAVICDETGKVVLCSDSPTGCSHQGMHINRDYLSRVIQNNGSIDTGVIENLYTDFRYIVSVPVTSLQTGQNMGIVIVSSPITGTLTVLKEITDIFFFVCILVILICMILLSFFARQQCRPLLDMARTASDFGHGNLTARVVTNGKQSEEVEELALAFNNMASSLQKSEYQRQEFVANVSHELKTPMTTISGYVDGILDGTIPEEKHGYYLRIVSDETKRLSRLVRSMLDISHLQTQEGIPEEQKTTFDLEECAGQMLITFEQKINQKNLNVQVNMPEHPVYTRANEDYISQVIYNLLDNAVKFSPLKGTLELTIREGGGKAYLSVANEGDTIPAEELPLVFERFHKLDKSRTKNRDGWGLGLYIVKTIICSHGEDISVTSRDGKTTFTFTMPLVN